MQAHRELIVEPIALDLAALAPAARPLDFPTLFGSDHPVEIEIGMGKGTFIVAQAKARPEVNFLGIERARWFWRYSSDRLRRAAAANARTVRAEASFFLSEFVGPSSVSVIHIYFPDPWPKKRHHKRRLIQKSFLLLVDRVLIPGGRLQIVTDHEEYFQHIQQTVLDSPLKIVEFQRPTSAGEGEVVGANFERKYRPDGRAFHAIAAVKN